MRVELTPPQIDVLIDAAAYHATVLEDLAEIDNMPGAWRDLMVLLRAKTRLHDAAAAALEVDQ